MEETTKTTTPAVANAGIFKPGHPRLGGRKKQTAMVRAMAEEMGVDPMAFMLSIIKTGTYVQTTVVNGKRTRTEVTAPLETVIDLAKYVSRFCYPTLTASEITGANDGPVQVANFDMAALLANSAAVELAQQLALSLIKTKTLPAPAGVLLGPPGENNA
jgi:hypothetical protein